MKNGQFKNDFRNLIGDHSFLRHERGFENTNQNEPFRQLNCFTSVKITNPHFVGRSRNG